MTLIYSWLKFNDLPLFTMYVNTSLHRAHQYTEQELDPSGSKTSKLDACMHIGFPRRCLHLVVVGGGLCDSMIRRAMLAVA